MSETTLDLIRQVLLSSRGQKNKDFPLEDEEESESAVGILGVSGRSAEDVAAVVLLLAFLPVVLPRAKLVAKLLNFEVFVGFAKFCIIL